MSPSSMRMMNVASVRGSVWEKINNDVPLVIDRRVGMVNMAGWWIRRAHRITAVQICTALPGYNPRRNIIYMLTAINDLL